MKNNLDQSERTVEVENRTASEQSVVVEAEDVDEGEADEVGADEVEVDGDDVDADEDGAEVNEDEIDIEADEVEADEDEDEAGAEDDEDEANTHETNTQDHPRPAPLKLQDPLGRTFLLPYNLVKTFSVSLHPLPSSLPFPSLLTPLPRPSKPA